MFSDLKSWGLNSVNIAVCCLVLASFIVYDVFFNVGTFNSIVSLMGAWFSALAYFLAFKIYSMWKTDATNREIHSRAIKLYGLTLETKQKYRDLHTYQALSSEDAYTNYLKGYDRLLNLKDELSVFIYMAEDLMEIEETVQMKRLVSKISEQLNPQFGTISSFSMKKDDPRELWNMMNKRFSPLDLQALAIHSDPKPCLDKTLFDGVIGEVRKFVVN
ncbi:hypothetical protein [Vibrio crassostreae]|uniref:hypothetical protein n=1 Tax=Vibrio crassostreae TaxID=246167 RepID=UPI000F460431|nr:hypothetical protein [Vibrio crassostreae]ROP23258.1 hypothetical protein EDB33_103364 [Vibrio crassostreae]ROP23896.1 hypothetical protein EDB34_103364 [Vibrio crassostreae]RPE98520.1 hypothetical protein EDB15_1032 [Vibrio crassostreae]TCV11364.1 hypothetical protein EDB16_108247 [Vibrio crassostreae]TCV25452.1 hypothetical protein EDB11_103364 [Vibrio crassostreae]